MQHFCPGVPLLVVCPIRTILDKWINRGKGNDHIAQLCDWVHALVAHLGGKCTCRPTEEKVLKRIGAWWRMVAGRDLRLPWFTIRHEQRPGMLAGVPLHLCLCQGRKARPYLSGVRQWFFQYCAS